MINVRGKIVVLTGDFRKYKRAEAEKLLEALGATCSGSVSKKTDMVFAGAAAGSKLDKARALGVAVHDEEALVAVLSGKPGGAKKTAKKKESTSTTVAGKKESTPTTVAGKKESTPTTVTGKKESVPTKESAPTTVGAAPTTVTPTTVGAAPTALAEAALLDERGWADLDEPAKAAAALSRAQWASFEPARDLPRLRAALAAHPNVGQVHAAATAALVERGARLVHARPHFTEIVSYALSPDRKHLASGAWVGDDYDRGATLALWEVATGRCVNVLDPIPGGVGWPEYDRQLQFTRDGKLLGVGMNTNGVALFDPFGATAKPLGQAYITDGWSRPPAWCLAPDGERAFIACWAGSEIPGAVIALAADPRRRKDPWGRLNTKPAAMAKKLPKAFKDQLEDKDLGLQPFTFVQWSDDGSRVYGHNKHTQGFSIDVKSGQLQWLSKLHAPVAWSPDGERVAHCPAGLVFYDGTTGLPTLKLPMHMGPGALYWARRGAVARLASLVFDENDFGAGPGVFLYEDGEFIEGLDAKPRPESWDDGDMAAWAWSADGTRGALLNDEGAVEHWKLDGARGEKLATWKVFEGARGVLYGDGVIVVVSRERVSFLRAADGAVLGDHDQLTEPKGARPLELGSRDVGAKLRPDPTFVLDEGSWGVAFEQGLVIADPSKRAALDAKLAWVVDRRFAWPTAWGALDVVATAGDGAGSARVPKGVKLERFKAKGAKKAEVFPPDNNVSDDELFSFALSAVENLHGGWRTHVSDHLTLVARLRARRGEHGAAKAVVEEVPEGSSRVKAAADCAMIAARLGDMDAARAVFAVAEALHARVLTEHSTPYVAASMGAAYHALGSLKEARRWFDRAEQTLAPEVNAWQKRLALAWAYLEVGLDEQAAGLWEADEAWQQRPLLFYYEPWFAYLVRSKRDEVLAAFLKRWKKSGSVESSVTWFVPTLYAARGDAKGLARVAKVLGVEVRREDRALCERKRDGTRVVPTEADVASLVEGYGKVMGMPRASRGHELRQLAEQCAAVGHFGAAKMLALQLKDTDMNDRPNAAFRILYCATTGTVTDPW